MESKKVKLLKDLAFYYVGSLLSAIAINAIISPNKISPGGVAGVATLLNFLFKVPVGFAVLVLNIPILIAGFKKLGGVFIVRTTLVTLFLSLNLEITVYILPSLIMDKILAAIFGGVLSGLGLSLVFLRGATTGGVDIIAKLITARRPHFTVGKIILALDGAVIVIAAICYRNIDTALYSIVSMFAASYLTDTFLYGADKGKIVYAITSKPDEICKAINERMKRGATRLSAIGGYTGQRRELIMCIVRRHEVSGVYGIINEHDDAPFIVVSEAGEIIGEGFKNFER